MSLQLPTPPNRHAYTFAGVVVSLIALTILYSVLSSLRNPPPTVVFVILFGGGGFLIIVFIASWFSEASDRAKYEYSRQLHNHQRLQDITQREQQHGVPTLPWHHGLDGDGFEDALRARWDRYQAALNADWDRVRQRNDQMLARSDAEGAVEKLERELRELDERLRSGR